MRSGKAPKTYSFHATAGSSYAANACNITNDYGRPAAFAQISNMGTTDVYVKLNNDSSAIFTLQHGTAQVFNPGDLILDAIAVANPQSGSSANYIEVIVGLV